MDSTPLVRTLAGARRRLPLPGPAIIGFFAAVVILLMIALFYARALDTLRESSAKVTRTLDTLEQLQLLLSSTKDAETGQRGFLLTGEESYLAPYNSAVAAIPPQVERLRGLTADNPRQLQRVSTLDRLVGDKLTELNQTIALLRAGNGEGAMAMVRSDRGRLSMERIRTLVADMARDERSVLSDRQEAQDRSSLVSAALVFGGCATLLVFVLIVAYMTSRDHLRKEAEVWLRAGEAGLAQKLQGERRIEVLGERILEYLAGYMGAAVGAVYVPEYSGELRRVAAYALPGTFERDRIHPGADLVGQAARDQRLIHVQDVPESYLPVSSALGRASSREIIIVPARADNEMHAVFELGFFRKLRAEDVELLDRVSENLAIAVRSARDRSRLEELLGETQRQAEELQAQQEELRVSNEELEEQGQSLRESTTRLEEQRSELEQTNTQLEEQAGMLESQRDALTVAQNHLSQRASDLEQANRYKSEFLANMSHELRTPLNSTLILSKLLADNKNANLTPDQVKFAETIFGAGNDLLALINDILDLSKIEARKVDLDLEAVSIRESIEALSRTLMPIAVQKGLTFGVEVDERVPATIRTDRNRFAQIIRNLVSNALKFTEKGDVLLKVEPGEASTIRFAVHDSGIGIAPDQHEVIFEAFRQADGSTHRKYGGTGLGLSISRDLARLLGGDVTVASSAGRGSTFTLVLPEAGPSDLARSPPLSRPPAAPSVRPGDQAGARGAESAMSMRGLAPPQAVDDDRNVLQDGARRMLIVEDDPAFAMIMRDVAHEMGYQCIVAHTANDGIEAARTHRPNAAVLDINLPDKSGLAVLDYLKRDPELRAIPVHIVSVADYSREALERGAVGYALKPVAREKLVEAVRQLEAKFSQRLRRVLVVEDDERQRLSIRQLLEMSDVEIVDVRSATEALAALRSSSFDCVVMDLNLPDLSGYQLLEQMAAHDEVSFPPVIVYTGRSLTRDEEYALRRLADSIIIKGARSPERLLDEVTLFLHQVEATLPPERQRMLKMARDRDATLDGRRVLVAEDDVRNIFALTSVLEPQGVKVVVARNGREALDQLESNGASPATAIDLVLMDIMMPEMDGLTAMREIRKRPAWKKLPVIALTAKAMPDDQAICLAAGASDYIAKPLDAEKLLSLIRVWMPKYQA